MSCFSEARTQHSLQMAVLGVEVDWERCAAHDCFKSERKEGTLVSKVEGLQKQCRSLKDVRRHY